MDSFEKTSCAIDDNTIKELTKGLLETYEPPLATISTHLKELTDKQNSVLTMVSSERRHLEDLQNDAEIDALMSNLVSDKERLVSISHSMMDLHKRVQSLRTRAANIERVAIQKSSQQNRPT